MKDFFAKNWKMIAAIAVVAVVVIVIYLYGKKKGVESTAPSIPGDNPNAPLTNEEKVKIRSLVDRLKEDIYDWDGGAFRDWPAYNEFATSSDRVFAGTANLYKSENNVSLKVDMQGEQYWLDQVPLIGGTDIIELIFNRFSALNIS